MCVESPHLSRLPAMDAASVTRAVVYTAGALRKALAAPSSEPRICFTFAARGARLSSSVSAPGWLLLALGPASGKSVADAAAAAETSRLVCPALFVRVTHAAAVYGTKAMHQAACWKGSICSVKQGA